MRQVSLLESGEQRHIKTIYNNNNINNNNNNRSFVKVITTER